MQWQAVTRFWFKDMGLKDWFFSKKPGLDALIRKKFLKTYWAVVRGETAEWRKTPRGRLAEIIVLDQFSRNMFRGTPEMYRYDPLALAQAQEALHAGADKNLTKNEKAFLDKGMPLGKNTRLMKDGAEAEPNDLNYFCVVEADSAEDVVEMFQDNPHLDIPTSYIDIMEVPHMGM